MTDRKERVKAFLKEYYALCKKYNLCVDACGCCNSPWIYEPLNEERLVEHIEHLVEEEKDLTKEDLKEVLGEDYKAHAEMLELDKSVRPLWYVDKAVKEVKKLLEEKK